jgi:hypothetical protein
MLNDDAPFAFSLRAFTASCKKMEIKKGWRAWNKA